MKKEDLLQGKKVLLVDDETDVLEALEEFKQDVQAGTFPAAEHCYPMPEDVAAELERLYPQ